MITIKIKDEKYIIEGDFEFEISPIVFDNELIPKREISFWWNPEVAQDLSVLESKEEMAEKISNKLKEDFYNALINSKI